MKKLTSITKLLSKEKIDIKNTIRKKIIRSKSQLDFTFSKNHIKIKKSNKSFSKNSNEENFSKISKNEKKFSIENFSKNEKISIEENLGKNENFEKNEICNHLTFQDISLAEEWNGNFNKFSRASSVNSFDCLRIDVFDKENKYFN